MVNFRSLIKRETGLLAKIAKKLTPAEHSLLVGSSDFTPLLLNLKTRYHYLCDDRLSAFQKMETCLAHYHELPFEPDSMNIILLPHTLEQTDNPALALEEAISILAPNGYLILLNTKKRPITQLGLNKHPLTIISIEHFSLPFSGLKQPWETYAEKCLPFLCQAYVLIAQKVVHSPLIITPTFINTEPAFGLRGEHACRRDIY